MTKREELLSNREDMVLAANDTTRPIEEREWAKTILAKIDKELAALDQNKPTKAAQRPHTIEPPGKEQLMQLYADQQARLYSQPEPKETPVQVKKSGRNAKIAVSESDNIRRIEITWPGESDAKIYDLAAISKLFHMTFNDLCKSWAAREKDYARLPERSPKGWMKATTLYYAAYVLSGEWLTAKRIGVQNMAPAVRRTVFQMIVEQAQKM